MQPAICNREAEGGLSYLRENTSSESGLAAKISGVIEAAAQRRKSVKSCGG